MHSQPGTLNPDVDSSTYSANQSSLQKQLIAPHLLTMRLTIFWYTFWLPPTMSCRAFRDWLPRRSSLRGGGAAAAAAAEGRPPADHATQSGLAYDKQRRAYRRLGHESDCPPIQNNVQLQSQSHHSNGRAKRSFTCVFALALLILFSSLFLVLSFAPSLSGHLSQVLVLSAPASYAINSTHISNPTRCSLTPAAGGASAARPTTAGSSSSMFSARITVLVSYL